jgi:hypothetical protein
MITLRRESQKLWVIRFTRVGNDLHVFIAETVIVPYDIV